MRRVTVEATTDVRTSAEVFEALVNLEDYPRHTPEVRAVTVLSTGTGQRSEWEVAFGNGTLRWIEEDQVDAAAGSLNFRLVEGDIASFAGSWRVTPAGRGCRVTFDAEFDLDIPGLTDVLEPVAAKAFAASVRSILHGLLGGEAAVSSGEGSSVDRSRGLVKA